MLLMVQERRQERPPLRSPGIPKLMPSRALLEDQKFHSQLVGNSPMSGPQEINLLEARRLFEVYKLR